MAQTPPVQSSVSGDVIISRGSILIYRVFDIAEEVDLAAVERILSSQATGQTRLKFVRAGRQAIVVRNPPVRIGLGDVDVRIGGATKRAELTATLWDYGVLSIVFQVPIEPGTPWGELVKRAGVYSGETGSDEIDAVARRKSQELSQLIAGAIKHSNEWYAFEDYVIYFLEKVAAVETGDELLQKANVPSLILGEPAETLSERATAGILDNVYQYATNDLVVIDWNSAIVLEPSGQRDIVDVLEFAVTHLLEVRYYDDLLDKRLSSLYDAIEARRDGLWRSNFAVISREANTRFIEFSEFIERVDNSLKVVGDFYLAVIFRAAVRRFRILDWQTSITRKMNMLARVAELLQGEINAHRSHALEVIIILLIAFEIFSAIIKTV